MEGDNEVRAGDSIPIWLVLRVISLQEIEIQVKEAGHTGHILTGFHLCEISGIGRIRETEHRLVDTRGWEEREMGSTVFPFGVMEMFWD